MPYHVETTKIKPFTSTDRLVKHLEPLTESLKQNERAIMLICFMYDNPGFKVIEKHRSMNYEEVKKVVENAQAAGLEYRQVNIKIEADKVTLDRYFKLDMIE